MTHAPKRRDDSRRRKRPRWQRIYRDLRAWLRQQLPPELLDEANDARIDLNFSLPLVGGDARDETRFRRSIEKQVTEFRDHLELETVGFRNGHLYCHWCQSSICDHSLPPDSRSVFVGYDATYTSTSSKNEDGFSLLDLKRVKERVSRRECFHL